MSDMKGIMAQRSTILIVDDSPTTIEFLNSVLGSEYEVLFATNGIEGLDIATRAVPDLILLDVIMPGIDGYELCARLKQDPKTRPIPVIFITAMSTDEDEARGLQAGAIDYIIKPISPPIVRARVSNHLELKKYRDLLENLSAMDGLTGIANRRKFGEHLDIEWRRAQRTMMRVSLIMVDIDDFKQYNDTYGHLAGDDCLRRVAGVLAELLRRPADICARYGGEEFACLLPGTEQADASRLAGVMKNGIYALAIPHATSRAADRVTISAGVATLMPLSTIQPSALIDMADKLLYQAKADGRNRVVSMAGR
jgi:diguanylate cyclase (GGDEF)-like protein